MSNIYENITTYLLDNLQADLNIPVFPGGSDEIINIAESPSIALRGPSFNPKEQDEEAVEVTIGEEIRRYSVYDKDDMSFDFLFFHNDKLEQVRQMPFIKKWFLNNKQIIVDGLNYTVRVDGVMAENSIPNYSNLKQWGFVFLVQDVILWSDNYEVVVKAETKEITTVLKT